MKIRISCIEEESGKADEAEAAIKRIFPSVKIKRTSKNHYKYIYLTTKKPKTVEKTQKV